MCGSLRSSLLDLMQERKSSCGSPPHQPERARPYIYSENEIKRLMAAALRLPVCRNFPDGSLLKRQTYYYLIGLLAVTGMRISEATNLKIVNVNLSEGILTIEGAKLGKSRLIPLHISSAEALRKYSEIRNAQFPAKAEDFFFVNRVGKQLDQGTIRRTFYLLSRDIGLRTRTRRKPNSLAFTIFGIVLQCRLCSAGTKTAKMRSASCRYCPHILVMFTSTILTGT